MLMNAIASAVNCSGGNTRWICGWHLVAVGLCESLFGFIRVFDGWMSWLGNFNIDSQQAIDFVYPCTQVATVANLSLVSACSIAQCWEISSLRHPW